MIETAHHRIREDDLILELTRVQNLSYGSALADLFYLPPQLLAQRASSVLKREVSFIRPTSCGEGIYFLGAALAEASASPPQKPGKPKTQLLGALLSRFTPNRVRQIPAAVSTSADSAFLRRARTGR